MFVRKLRSALKLDDKVDNEDVLSALSMLIDEIDGKRFNDLARAEGRSRKRKMTRSTV